jgi:6-phosphogluconolactonase
MSASCGRASAVLLTFLISVAVASCGSSTHVCPAASGALCTCGNVAGLCAIPPAHVFADGIDGQISVFPVDRGSGTLSSPISVTGPSMSLGIAAVNDQYLYVSDFGLGGPASIDIWSINQSTGGLTPVSPFALGTLSIAAGLAINTNNQVLYVADAGKIDALQPNDTTGALTPISGSPFPSGTNLYLTIDPSGQFLFASVADPPGGVAAFTMDSFTGTLTPVPGSPFSAVPNSTVQPGQIVADESGKFVYVTLVQSNQVAGLAIATPSGALTPVPGSPFNTGSSPLTLAIVNQFLYVSNLGDGTLSAYAIDSASGALTPVAGSPFPIRAAAMTSDFFDGYLFVSGTGGMTAFKVDLTTGALTQVGSPMTFAGATALTFVQ